MPFSLAFSLIANSWWT